MRESRATAANLEVEFRSRPSALRFMAGALRSYPPLASPGALPPIRARWRGFRLEERDVAAFLRWTGLAATPALPSLLPHALAFRLPLVVLTHGAFPLPIWRALQIRNRIVGLRALAAGDILDLETAVGSHRVLERGLEVDLHTTARAGGDLAWSGVTTFYWRGRFGTPGPAAPLATAPDVAGEVVATWRAPTGAGLPMAALTGDYNPLHWSSPYARRSGFPRAFLHPQLAAGQCLAHLRRPEGDAPERVDLWLKGPVPRGAELTLRASAAAGVTAFALTTSMEERPAIVGAWRRTDEEPATSR